MTQLERRYRWLLLCYPRAYRRELGDEMVATLLDLAATGRDRPTVREAINLTRHGLRCRLGRPASRTVAVWALLTAVIFGLFAAAVSTRLAWETARPEPTAAEIRAVAAEAVPGWEVAEPLVAGDRFHLVHDGAPADVLFGLPLLGGQQVSYDRAVTRTMVQNSGVVDIDAFLGAARQHLGDAGWRVFGSATWSTPCVSGCYDGVAELGETVLTARRGDTVVTLLISSEYPQGGGSAIELMLHRATPAAVYVAAVAGGLLGAVVAWLVFAWASRRTEGRESVKAFLGATLLAWWFPVPLVVVGVSTAGPRLWHWQWPPMWVWLGQPAFSGTLLLGGVTAVLALAVAAGSRAASAVTPSRVRS